VRVVQAARKEEGLVAAAAGAVPHASCTVTAAVLHPQGALQDTVGAQTSPQNSRPQHMLPVQVASFQGDMLQL
jgi:hypothetical protein